MKKKLFYVTKTQSDVKLSYEPSVRNILLNQQLKRTGGVPDELPEGDWVMRFSWEHSLIIPGLLFREA